jgi:PAS domain S-box-containing protein
MISASVPPNEPERLAALSRTRLLDSPPEDSFDDFALLAAQIAQTPIALVSLVDRDRQWFKARVGLATSETPRCDAFCSHAILRREVFEIGDAELDPRFADNPLVVGEPHVRFYAGAPLITQQGFALGTLCVIDHVPRKLTETQRACLLALARRVSAQIEARLDAEALAELSHQVLEQARTAQRQTALLELAQDVIVVQSASREVLFWSAGAERTTGIPRHEALGRDAHALLRTRFPVPRSSVEKALLRDGRWDGELMIERPDGRIVALATKWVLQRDEMGAPVAILEAGRDVTERREVDRLKTEFVSTVSHELRTPLTAIRGSLGLVEGGIAGELPAEALELVSVARANCERLVRLVSDILDLEKLASGRMPIRLSESSPRSLVDASLANVRPLAAEARVNLQAEIDDDVPPLRVDVDRIVQLLTNYLANAVSFSSSDDTVLLLARRVAAGVRFEVVDQGPGISANDLGKLFKQFQQLDGSDRRPRNGTGLGLAICKSIAEQHGGFVGVQSKPGEGATFWVELPF